MWVLLWTVTLILNDDNTYVTTVIPETPQELKNDKAMTKITALKKPLQKKKIEHIGSRDWTDGRGRRDVPKESRYRIT